jgi:hypothetical protein
VVELLLPPTVRVPLPSRTFPAPASEPMVSEKPSRLKVAAAATLTAEEPGRPLETPSWIVPPLIVVAPV